MLEELNTGLSRVRIIAKKNSKRFYLRATLPPKPGEAKPKQRDLPTGCENTPKGRAAAKAKAQQLESDIILERFDWRNWGSSPPPKTIGEWCEAFEENYWLHHKKTPGREDDFKNSFLYCFESLPPDLALEKEVLRDRVLRNTEPKSCNCRRYANAYAALARFAGESWHGEIRKLGYGYTPRDRDIPSLEEIIAARSLFKHEGWLWVFDVLVCFGLRPHEAIRATGEGLKDEPPKLIVPNNTKTGKRDAYPLNANWIEEWDLANVRKPNLNLSRTNKRLGEEVPRYFKRHGIPFTPYCIRHRYALEWHNRGLPDRYAALWMGHSVDVHQKKYLRHITQDDTIANWRKYEGYS